jgi:Zn-dependent M28 family amino/carboxypeptidase
MPNKVIKLTAVFSILAVGLVLIAATLRQSTAQSDNPERVTIQQDHSPFQADRAYQDLEKILAYGPRKIASEAARKTRDYLEAELDAIGIKVQKHTFTANTPIGNVEMHNLIAKISGTEPGVILLGNHYDTKLYPGDNFLGANDGGATTAWMLEFARTVGPTREGRSLWLTWFDGEEAIKRWSATDGIYGSRQFVQYLKETNELQNIHTMINVDMIGDCHLSILKDRGAPEWLNATVWTIATKLGYKSHFSDFSQSVQDDHIPFRKANIPALEIIDFSYGGSKADHRKNWHTPNDTIERVCPESLQVVADVIYHAIPAVEDYLDRLGSEER